MSDKAFFDTNVLVYAYSATEPLKQIIAQKLINECESFISTQVLQELTNIITKKFKFSYQSATNAVEECCQNSGVFINSKETILLTHRMADRYNFFL